ncbi:MAG: FxsA family protein [Bacillota bacterium]
MLIQLVLLFTLVPLLELFLLIEVGKLIGTWPAIFLVAATGFFGVLLARSQGLQVLYRMRRDMMAGLLPGEEILDGVCILVGGAMLLTPGLITDVVGFSLLIPVTRSLYKKGAYRLIRVKLAQGMFHFYRRW